MHSANRGACRPQGEVAGATGAQARGGGASKGS